jgi:hypothetical protein
MIGTENGGRSHPSRPGVQVHGINRLLNRILQASKTRHSILQPSIGFHETREFAKRRLFWGCASPCVLKNLPIGACLAFMRAKI